MHELCSCKSCAYCTHYHCNTINADTPRALLPTCSFSVLNTTGRNGVASAALWLSGTDTDPQRLKIKGAWSNQGVVSISASGLLHHCRRKASPVVTVLGRRTIQFDSMQRTTWLVAQHPAYLRAHASCQPCTPEQKITDMDSSCIHILHVVLYDIDTATTTLNTP